MKKIKTYILGGFQFQTTGVGWCACLPRAPSSMQVLGGYSKGRNFNTGTNCP